MNNDSTLITIRINKRYPIQVFADISCDSYMLINENFAKKLRLPRVNRTATSMRGFIKDIRDIKSTRVAVFTIETNSYVERIYIYVISELEEDLFLSKPWFEKNRIVYDVAEQRLYHSCRDIVIQLVGQEELAKTKEIRDTHLISAAAFIAIYCKIRRAQQDVAGTLRTINIADIDKALQSKLMVDPKEKIPKELLEEFGELFSLEAATKLPLHRPGIDHEIHLIRKPNGQEPLLP